jgi:hypothetical protein
MNLVGLAQVLYWRRCHDVGWTSPDWEDPKMAMVLQEVHLNYLPNDQCELASRSKTKGKDAIEDDDDGEVLSFKGRIHPDHLCTTGGPKNKRDAWYVVFSQG